MGRKNPKSLGRVENIRNKLLSSQDYVPRLKSMGFEGMTAYVLSQFHGKIKIAPLRDIARDIHGTLEYVVWEI